MRKRPHYYGSAHAHYKRTHRIDTLYLPNRIGHGVYSFVQEHYSRNRQKGRSNKEHRLDTPRSCDDFAKDRFVGCAQHRDI